ncbi:MAG: hypothetical protein ACR2QC_07470 [Gammaproteobacteria bacterium]
MPDNRAAGGGPDIKSAAEIAKDLMRQENVQEVKIRATEKEVEISVKRPPLSAVWTTLWSASKKIFGGFLK